MSEEFVRVSQSQYRSYRRRQLRTSAVLFLATLLSTFFVGSGFAPFRLLYVSVSPQYREMMERNNRLISAVRGEQPRSIESRLAEDMRQGLTYAIPLMTILLCHEMGHFLQAVRYRIPASFPYFIPLPIPPLGTMGAVILQGRGVANRRQMFDIAVSGPIAGLLVTIPILIYGLRTSEFRAVDPQQMSLEFGEPLLLQWMIHWLHGATPEGQVMFLNGYGFAGWVGVFITAINLLPIGQLDGGHILYTLIGRRAHTVALLLLATGVVLMILTGTYSYILLIFLLLLTGARHPPTADDRMSIGWGRHVIGWLTLSFLIIGFTPQPIIVQERPQQQEAPENDRGRRIDPRQIDPDLLVWKSAVADRLLPFS